VILSLTAEAQKLIEQRMKSGKYGSAEEVVTAALHALESDEHAGDFEPGDWDKLLAEGQQSGPPLDGDSVFAELRNLRSRQARAG
jgi:antitoxin ParD1/3/4